MKKIFICFIILITLIQTQVMANTVAGGNLFIDADDTLYQLEFNSEQNIHQKDKMLDNVKFIDSCYYAVKNDGTLWSWWKYTEESIQFSDNSTKIMDNVRSVSGRGSHTLAVKNDNTLWGFGLNDCCQLGERERQRIPEYKAVKLMNNVKKAVAGDFHSLILKTDGSVWTLGSNEYGELGCGNDIQESGKPIKIMEKVKDIFAGEASSFAIDENDTLWCWGSIYGRTVGSKSGQDHYPVKYTDNVKAISSREGFSLVLKKDNSVWIYGRNEQDDMTRGLQVPKKIADNIHTIDDGGVQDRAFLVDNNGKLYLFELTEKNNKTDYVLNNVSDKVKISEDITSEEVKEFYDMSGKSQEMQEAVLALSQAGIINGTSETEFSPDKPLTRAELAALLLRVSAKENDGNTDSGFIDVTHDKWYYNTAGASKKYGIISGFEDNTFRGDEPVSKLQTISLVSRVLRSEKEQNEESEYTYNQYEIPDWAKYDVCFAEVNGLIDKEKDLINFNEIMTRGEAAVILYRLYEKI